MGGKNIESNESSQKGLLSSSGVAVDDHARVGEVAPWFSGAVGVWPRPELPTDTRVCEPNTVKRTSARNWRVYECRRQVLRIGVQDCICFPLGDSN
jgi:hypothetical protein